MADTWVLLVRELPSGRLTVDGLPEDRAGRQSLTWRLLDVIRAVQHADDTEGHGDGLLWQQHAKAAYVHGWILGEDG